MNADTNVHIPGNFLGLVLSALGLLLVASSVSAQDADRGAQRYKLCAGCHGFKGEGNELVGAPALAGLETWYLERQARNFKDGFRGHADGDVVGGRMAMMTRGLETDEEIGDVVAQIATLPAALPRRTVDGDAERGRATYATCGACHGVSGEGNEALNAPALAGLDDWYQLAQLIKFKNRLRGASAGDVYGQQMAPMAATLEDEQAMKDVIAYITSLTRSR
jgi:cytochrome c oxidase subunit II